MPLPRKLLTLGLTGALGAGLLGAGLAVAQTGPGDIGGPVRAGFAHLGGHKHAKAALGLRAIVDASGLDRAVFAEGFAAGKSINTILAENGVDSAEVQAQVLATLDTKLAEAVASGAITQERADEARTRAQEALPALMDRVPDGSHAGAGQHRAKGAILEVAADAIGITVDGLRASLADGGTLADAATANGIDPGVVVDAIEAAMVARIDQALADGKIDAAKANQLKARAHGMAEKIVHSAPGHGRPGPAGSPAQ